MPDTNPLDILKDAILLEKRGKAFYRLAASQASSDALKDFFNTMADEEVSHVMLLSDQYKAYKEKGSFDKTDAARLKSGDDTSAKVISKKVVERVEAADFEAAAISAAMLMEEKAIALYSERAKTAADPEEKKLYTWLADWEKEHLAFLAAIDTELKERIWNDNSFWPF